MAMGDAEKLSFTCSLAGIDAGGDEASLIGEVYLPLARSRVLELRYPWSADPELEDFPSRYDMLQCEIAAYLYDRRGAEGETSHSENGVNRSWATDDLPSRLAQRVVPLGRVVG